MRRHWVDGNGYINVYFPEHPRASSWGMVHEHILVAEAALGKPLPAGAEIHHVDGNPSNNTPSNLVICQSLPYHRLLHLRERILRAGGDPNTQRKCTDCKQFRLLDEFSRWTRFSPDGLQRRCKECAKRRYLAYVRPNKRQAVVA